MARGKRRKPSKAEIKAAADRAEKPPAEDSEPVSELVPIDPEIEPAKSKMPALYDLTTAKGRRGPKEKYDPGDLADVQAWARNGLTEFEISQNLGIDPATLWRWKAKHPELRKALRIGRLEPNRRVKNSVYHRAVGYAHENVKIFMHEGAPVAVRYTEHMPPDVAAAKLWLYNQDRENWKERTSQEISGPDGGPIQVDDVTDLEKARRIAFYLREASEKIKGQRT